MTRKSVFKEGSGSRKGFVSEFQKEIKTSKEAKNNKSKIVNKIFNKSSENMEELVDNCVALTYRIWRKISSKCSKPWEKTIHSFL